MKTTDRLIAAAWDIWNGYCEHPFVLEMRDGVLERDKFRHYIVQDYFYLIDYASAGRDWNACIAASWSSFAILRTSRPKGVSPYSRR